MGGCSPLLITMAYEVRPYQEEKKRNQGKKEEEEERGEGGMEGGKKEGERKNMSGGLGSPFSTQSSQRPKPLCR